MKSVRSLTVVALIVAAVSAARAFSAYEPPVRDVSEFMSSRPVPARDETYYWKQLLYPMLRNRLRREDNRHDFKEIISGKQTLDKTIPVVTPPPDTKEEDGQHLADPIYCYLGTSAPGPAFVCS